MQSQTGEEKSFSSGFVFAFIEFVTIIYCCEFKFQFTEVIKQSDKFKSLELRKSFFVK